MQKIAFVLAVLAACSQSRRICPEFEINLDLAPEQRYVALIPTFNATVWAFFTKDFLDQPKVLAALYAISDKRGPENDEQQREINGMAAVSGLPVKFVQGIQMLYELQTLMVPVENISAPYHPPGIPKEFEDILGMAWRGPGCTGIIATCGDGTVNHARNLDFSPWAVMTHLAYTGIFTKGGKELFRSQMVAGYTMVITAMKMGPNGFTLERNTRYPAADSKGNEEMFHNLLTGRALNGWTLRQLVIAQTTYEGFVMEVIAAKYCSTEYAIISGVKKGVIISRDPEAPAYIQTLNKAGGNFEEPNNYIIITNFDFFFHDIREYFDPTGGKIFAPRRIAAQKILNATIPLTAEILFDTINAKGVLADTIFQAVMNVELGLWNVSLPDIPNKTQTF